jgi:hypothetical protein
MRTRTAILILAGSAALAGCAYGYGDYGPYGGLSLGMSYGDYGYGGYGGYGYGGYGYPYGGYGYPGYYGGFGAPYYGWYDNYYYPGTGYYVYDSYRRPHVWNDTQQRYWTQQRDRALSTTRTNTVTATSRPALRENWSGFNRQSATDRTTARSDRREARQEERTQRRDTNNPPHP